MNAVIFEGGVAGGLSSLIAFQELMRRVRAAGESGNIKDICEVMAGTGTGALIACMLGLLMMDVEAAISAYTRLVEQVFSSRKIISTSGSRTYKASKLEEELKRIVKDATGDENTPMISSAQSVNGCKVMVFTLSEHNLNASTPRIFRSYENPNNQMPNCPIWQAIRASMAHPELFKSITIGDGATGESLIGGDVGYSNPTRHVLAEISDMYPERQVSSIVCMGAGHARTIEIPRSNSLHRVMPTNVLVAMKEVATDSERVAQEMAGHFEGIAKLYWRFSVDQGMQDVRMSQWQKKAEVVAHTRAYMQKAEVTKQMSEAAKAMKERKAAMQAKHISGKLQHVQQQQARLTKRCPAPSPVFTGRDEQVSQVSNCILGPPGERRVCVLHGLGGSGKTQIALKAVERTLDGWTNIAYIDATSKETIESTLKGFAQANRLGETYEDAIRWLGTSNEPWLLALDNADDPTLRLADYIPGGAHGSILITTRLSGLALLGQGPRSDCAVGRMEQADAVELLVKKARRQDEALSSAESEAAEKLVEDLGCLALAMVHAGAYIWYSKISISKYRELCQENTRTALERYSKLPTNMEEYEKTVYTTWMMSYERLSTRSQQFLWISSYLHHDMIKEDIFRRAADNLDRKPNIPVDAVDQAAWSYVEDYLRTFLNSDKKWNTSLFSEVVDELLSYSLIGYDRANEVYTVHVLVWDWARSMPPHTSSDSLKHASHLLALSISRSKELAAYMYQIWLVPHISKILGDFETVDANDAIYFARVYQNNQLWREQERLLMYVAKEKGLAHGKDHPDTLNNMVRLARTYRRQGRWDEAEKLCVKTLDVQRRVRGEDHHHTLSTMSNLAAIYREQGRLDEAEALQAQALDLRRKIGGEHHPNTLISMGRLATIYRKQGRWDEAEALDVRTLDAKRQVYGEDHPETLISMLNLSFTYQGQGKWNEVEPLQLQTLAAEKRVSGELHNRTLNTMKALAQTYKAQGERRKKQLEALKGEISRVEAALGSQRS